MKRHTNFEKRPLEKMMSDFDSRGFDYWNLESGPEKLPYWQEGVVYAFKESDIKEIAAVTQEIHDMSYTMVEKMITSGDYPQYFNLDEESIPLIEQSWRMGDKSLYGRFDLAYGVDGSLKMFEYNGDTPVSILECSVIQWDYILGMKNLDERLKQQYNFLDETLQETWKRYFNQGQDVYFSSGAGFRHEDFGNLCYIMDTALRAGLNPKEIQMQNIGVNTSTDGTGRKIFTDLDENEIKNIFKLYPWEWMTEEKFGKHIIETPTRWLEPAWKMLLSNKAMLVKLWEMFPNHPNLLASFNEDHTPKGGRYAKKAIHGREGSNIFISQFCSGEELTALAPGSHKVDEYDHWGYMYQQWHDVKKHDGMTPIIGSWVIGDKACGMSIREDANVVTGNDAFFASHIVVSDEDQKEFEFLLK